MKNEKSKQKETKKISPIELLDEVLIIFNTTQYNSLHLIALSNLLKEKNIDIPQILLMDIVSKLEVDGFIKKSKAETISVNGHVINDVPFYLITIEGEIFQLKNGYKGVNERTILEKAKDERRDWLMIRGTWVAGIGACLLVAWEIFKYFFLEHH